MYSIKLGHIFFCNHENSNTATFSVQIFIFLRRDIEQCTEIEPINSTQRIVFPENKLEFLLIYCRVDIFH